MKEKIHFMILLKVVSLCHRVHCIIPVNGHTVLAMFLQSHSMLPLLLIGHAVLPMSLHSFTLRYAQYPMVTLC